jgi:hypothetical protein
MTCCPSSKFSRGNIVNHSPFLLAVHRDILQVSEKSGTNGNFNYFSYFYLQVKGLIMALTLDERVEIVLLGIPEGTGVCC